MKVKLARLFGMAMVIAGPGSALAQNPNQLPRPLAQAIQLEPTSTDTPMVALVDIPSAYVQAVSLKLEVIYRDITGVHISPDVRTGKLIVMAPPALQGKIQAQATQILFEEMQPAVSKASATQVGTDGRYQVRLAAITWREFEDSLSRLVGKQLPVTTSRNGEQARFQLTGAPLDGSVIDIDRRENTVTVVAPGPTMPGWQAMIQTLDQMPQKPGQVTEMVKLVNAKQASIQQAIRMLDSLKSSEDAIVVPTQNGSPFKTTAFQAPNGQAPGNQAGPSGQPATLPTPLPSAQPLPTPSNVVGLADEGTGIIGETQIQFVPQLGIFIVRGAKKDVQRVLEVIKQIEDQSIVTQPVVEVHLLKHLNSAATADLLIRLYTDVLSARQGDVSITSLDQPNALLLIGREEAVKAAKALIDKIDTPTDATSQLRVFRLENASAVDAEETINSFFVDRPGEGDDLRPGLGTRVRVVSDYRSNSLIVSASPRDLVEVSRLISELDVASVPAQNEIRVFPLQNSLAADLAPVLQTAINGTGDAETDENSSRPSTALSIVSLDSERGGVLDSGILAHVVVTADANANAVVVRAPASSMNLIGELIRQLDQVPGAESFVKVFTVQNGDALKLTTALQALFGGGSGTANQAGAANAAGLAPATASPNNSLVGLTFTTDQRTNSIIASGSASDLEVVESILLRLDTEGFAERITEVIWLRHQSAPEIATAITNYVSQRTQSATRIQQYQQGLGPFDLPDRDLIVVAEVISNSLILSVSPRLYDEVRRLIDNLDRRPPMVLIKVVLAEVTLGDQFELGGQIGLQDSLLFDRSLAAGGTIPTTVNNSTNAFNFGNIGTPNNTVVNQNQVGSRALSTFGLGTQSSQLGYGGFVLSAASDSFNLLFRALQDANRAQILSRPQIMTVDNKAGFVQVGQRVARVSGIINNGLTTQVVPTDVDVGLILEVLPRVGADGLISMQIRAERSAINQSQPGTSIGTDSNGNAITIPNIDTTNAETTITAYSGQTVVFGGLIQKQRTNQSRRVPYLADIPLLGVMFKFDRETEQRSELLIIMTPMLVTGDEDIEYVKQIESSRMSYCLADVVEMHGDVGLNPGYGLWGPAVGPVIYPDLQPTIDQFPTEGSVQSGETIISERVISEEPLGTSRMVPDGPSLNEPTQAPSPLEPVEAESIPTPSNPSSVSPQQPNDINVPTPTPSAPQPRSGNRQLPQDKRLTTQPSDSNIRRASVMAPKQTSQGATRQNATGVNAADYKFIDEQAAASMSGIAR